MTDPEGGGGVLHRSMRCSRMLCCAFRGPVGLRAFLFGSKLNLLFVLCAPLAFAAELNHWGEAPTFILATLAIIPLAERLGFLTEQLTLHTNDTLGGMLNATFGNAVETLMSVVALVKARDALEQDSHTDAAFFLNLVQTSLLGSMLSNLLLVQGSAFFIGGLRHPLQSFSREGAVTSTGLLVMATLALSVPTMMWSMQSTAAGGVGTATKGELAFSRFVSFVLLIIYLCFCLFQLGTHRFLFEKGNIVHQAAKQLVVAGGGANGGEVVLHRSTLVPQRIKGVVVSPAETTAGGAGGEPGIELSPLSHDDVEAQQPSSSSSSTTVFLGSPHHRTGHNGRNDNDEDDDGESSVSSSPLADEDTTSAPPPPPATAAAPKDDESEDESIPELPESEEEVPEIGLSFCVLYLVLSTVAVSFVSHIVVEAAQGAVTTLNLDAMFVGGVILPIVGNAAEHASALMFAWKDKMDTSIAIAVGSAIQIPLFVLPVCVLCAWGLEVPLSLNIDRFLMAAVVLTSLAVSFTLHAGASHWLHGLILIFEYVIIAAAFWFHD